MSISANRIIQILEQSQVQLLAEWMKYLRAIAASKASGAITDAELQAQCHEFIALFRTAVAAGQLDDVDAEVWRPVREFLAGVSKSRGRQGYSPSETAMFVFSFKEPLV